MFHKISMLSILFISLCFSSVFAFSHNPNNTVTIFVHGFDANGYKRDGVFGEDRVEDFFREVPTFLGLPTIENEEDRDKANVVTSTTYYGNIYPDYYTQKDKDDIDNSEDGIPKYALIVAKYAKHLLQRTGAKQVNFISGSMGALVTRYLIEKNLENLASQKKIARWMTIEGVVNGNYAASKSKLYKIIDHFDKFPIEANQMKYSWIESKFGSPRNVALSPYYQDILIGHETSTKDNSKEHALTLLMLSHGQFQPNDGYQAANDTYFSDVLNPYRFYGQNPTHSYLHENHLGVKDSKSLWMQIGNFLLSNKRVKITILDAKVDNIKEKNRWYAKFLPADVVFESEIFSPLALNKWGLDSAISQKLYKGAVPKIVKYKKNGETKDVNEVIYDDFVLPKESNLDIRISAKEIDGDVRYGILESFKDRDYDYIGLANFTVALRDGIYQFNGKDFSGRVKVEVFNYPFALLGEDGENISGGDENVIKNRGDLVFYERVLSKDSDFMKQSLKSFIKKYPDITSDNIEGIEAYRIVYTTLHNGKLINASGLVTVPKDIDKPVSIISEQHGTMFKRKNAPSLHDPLTTTGAIISSLKGYAVSMPDYIGYGNSADLEHPYLIKESLAISITDMIKATKELLKLRDIKSDNRLFLMGYSEGGFATLAALEYIEKNISTLNVTAAAPMAGSYDLKTTADIILSQESYQEAHLPLFLIYSYDKYYNLNLIDRVYKEPYLTDIKKYFNKEIDDIKLSTKREELYKDQFIDDYFSDHEFELKDALVKNSLISWTPKSQVRLYHCLGDRVVPAKNSQEAYNSFIESGSQSVELVLKEGGSHSSCSLPFYIDALEWFDTFR